MSTIPKEYLIPRSQEDFGFTAVDEDQLQSPLNSKVFETEIIKEKVGASAEGIFRLENKIDTILSLYNDGKLGLDAERIKLQQESNEKLKALEELIVPLLVNLMKNPEKEYIYWPNRKDKLQEQIDKVLKLTRN